MLVAHCLPPPCFTSMPSLPSSALRRQSLRAALDITSPRNPRLKLARSLLSRRHRDKTKLILLEGQRLIDDALNVDTAPRHFFYTDEAMQRSAANRQLRDKFDQAGVEGMRVSESIIRMFSDTVNPQGLVAVFERPNLALPSSASLALICDEIRDPGNLGTLLRSAASAGVDGVILTTGCADVWGLKVLRGGMGAQFRVPIRANQSWDEAMEIVRAWDCKVRVADGEGENYTALDWKGRYAVVIGGEADGPGERAFEESEKIVGIRLGGGMESLNAAVAGSIILFEARRQRGQ